MFISLCLLINIMLFFHLGQNLLEDYQTTLIQYQQLLHTEQLLFPEPQMYGHKIGVNI